MIMSQNICSAIMLQMEAIIILFNKRKLQMNTNNSAFTRLQNSFLDKSGVPSAKDEKDLYQSVLHKHYQIIQTFLEKINSLYIKNQEFEITLNSIQDRLDKIQNNNSNIHYEFRTTHLMMDKRLNSIMAEYTNMNQQIRLIRQEIPVDTYLSTHHLLTKSAFLKNRKTKHRGKFESNGSIVPKIIVNGAGTQNKENKQSKIESSWNLGEVNAITSLQEFHRISQTCKVIFPQKIESRMDSESQTSSKQISCRQLEENPQEKEIDQESTSKPNMQQEKFGVIYDKQWVENEFARHLDQFTAKMNLITQQWNEEKTKIKNQIFGNEAEKYFNALEAKFDQKLGQMKDQIYIQQSKMKKQIDYVNETSLKNIGALEYKLSQKVQSRFFEESMNNLSSAISQQLANNEKHFSNKHETQRAIRFLQNKINKIIEEDENGNSSTLLKSFKDTKQEQQPCLRINKCISQKKTDLSTSEKNINPKCTESQQQIATAHHNIRSLNISTADLQKYQKSCSFNESKENINPTEPKKINWKSSSSDKLDAFKIQSEAKIRKTSISKATPVKYRSSYSNFMPEERIVEKEWKEKVVKILHAGDRKKVKVTFH